MQANNTIVVVSRYNRDTSWTRKLTDKGYTVLIYEHGEHGSTNNPYNLGINKGKEASSYLKYIIDKYDCLPTYSVFLHDKMKSWHHAGNVTDLVLNNEGSSKQYFNFNNRVCSTIKNGVWKEMQSFFTRFLEPYIGPKEEFGDWTVNHLCCAQFVCHKKKITQHPKAMYQNIYNWIIKTNMDHEITGRLLEWTWRIIFNPNEYKLKKTIDINNPKEYKFNPKILKKNAIT
jgi:hypothetical protein